MKLDSSPAHPQPVPTKATLGRVLLAEASPLIRRMMANKLKCFCCEVEVAVDSREAAAAILWATDFGHPFDVVLMNVQPPMIDGLGVIRRLRQLTYMHPILAITATGMEGERLAAIEAGSDDVVSKPIDWDLLRSKMLRFATVRSPMECEMTPITDIDP